jgi:hypothetical protein
MLNDGAGYKYIRWADFLGSVPGSGVRHFRNQTARAISSIASGFSTDATSPTGWFR